MPERNPQGQFVPEAPSVAAPQDDATALAGLINQKTAEQAAEAPAPAPETPPAEAAPAPTEEPQGPLAGLNEGQVAELFKGQSFTVDGEVRTGEELLKSPMFQNAFTKKSQALAQEREDFKREQDVLRRLGVRPQAGLDAPASSWDETPPWGQGATSPQDMVAGREHPYAATPTAPASAPVSQNPEDYVTYGDMALIRQNVAELRQSYQNTVQAVEKQRRDEAEERRIDAMEKSIPGFTRAAVDVHWHLLTDPEQQAYTRLPKANAYELIWYRHGLNKARAAPVVTEEQPTEPAPAAAPIAERSRVAAPSAGSPQAPEPVLAKDNPTDAQLKGTFDQLIAAAEAKRAAQ